MKATASLHAKPIRLVLEQLKKDANVDFGMLFGSRKTGKSRAGSDLDLAVYFKNPPEGMALMDYVNGLSKIAGIEVDLTVLNRASAFLRHQVFKTSVSLVVRDPDSYRRFREKTITDYQEYQYVSGMPAYD